MRQFGPQVIEHESGVTLHRLIGYVVALIAITATTVVLVMIEQQIHGAYLRIPFILIIGAIAYFYGLGPTVFAYALAVFGYLGFLMPPARGFLPMKPADWAMFITFLISTFVSGIGMLVIRMQVQRTAALTNMLNIAHADVSEMLDRMGESFITMDYDGRFTYVNAAAEKLLRKSRNELLGRIYWEVFPAIIGTKFHSEYKGLIETMSAVEYEEYYPPYELWAEVRAYPLPRRIVVFVRDINRRKMEQEELKRAKDDAERVKATLQVIMDTVPVGIILAEAPAGRVAYTNEKLSAILGEPLVGEVSGPGPGHYELLHPDGTLFEPDELPLPRCLKSGKPLSNIELLIRRRDGTTLTVNVHCAPIFNAKGDTIAAVSSLDDMTELIALRRSLEEALEHERHFSLLLQRALLPAHLNMGECCKVAALYLPAYASREIGGDFYDAFTVPDGRAAVLIGDVAGKGLEAASLAATTRNTVHAFVHEAATAAEALSKACPVITAGISEPSEFVTVFLAIIDCLSGDFSYSIAGHPPLAIRRKSGRIDPLSRTEELPLGLIERQIFTDFRGHLDEGDLLVLYTDGITEARHEGELFEVEGVERTLQQISASDAESAAEELMTAASKWAGGKPADDAAVVVVERR